jgi:HTTM domain
MARPVSLRAAWDRFWYRPEGAENLAMARIILAGTALWVVLSRYDMPAVLTFPPEVWSGVSPERRVRFLMLFGLESERVLYGALHVTLVGALVGILPRVACVASALLLYHFAPFETVIRTPNPYLRGLTLPTLGLLIVALGPCGGRFALFPRPVHPPPDPSPAYRWPLVLVQVLFCQIYFFAGYAKLFTSGLAWATPDNIRGHLLILNQILYPDPASSPGYAVARSAVACAVIALGGLAFELVFPVILFSRAARWILVPVAAAFHVANSLIFRIFFQNVTLLLLFVDWSSLLGRPKAGRS